MVRNCIAFCSIDLNCVSLVVTFELNEDDYRAFEGASIRGVINKNRRIANPVTLLVSPQNLSVADPVPSGTPPDDSSNRAKGELTTFGYTKHTVHAQHILRTVETFHWMSSL